MDRPLLRTLILLSVVITAAILLTDRLPLGVPGEWVWSRVPITAEGLVGAFLALLAGAAYIAFALWGSERIDRCDRIGRYGWLAALVACGFAWIWAALSVAPATQGYARVPWVLYYPRSSGYFWQARYEVESVPKFLSSYEALLAERDYLHIGTHPPGLTLSYCGLLELCRSNPALTDVILATQPAGFAEAIETLRELPTTGTDPIASSDAACLWLALLLTQLAAVLTTLGIYGLAVRHYDRRIAWMAACLWPLVPAVLVFLPKSDVLYALPAVMAAWLWLTACDRQSLGRGVLAGVVLWVGMMLSLAFATVIGLIGAMTLWELWARRDSPTAPSMPLVSLNLASAPAVGFLVPTMLLGWFGGVNLWNVWSWNLSNHALFYAHNPRTWWAWLLVNPLELSLAVGLPVVLTAGYGIVSHRKATLRDPRLSSYAAFVVVWGLLWLSGKNMGEAARLWILLMPWVVLMAADGLARSDSQAPEKASRPAILSIGGWVLVAQLLVALVTILRVDGFHFADLLTG